MGDLTEKQLHREEIFRGVALHVVKDDILLPDGKRSVREISLHNGAAAVIPILDDGRVPAISRFAIGCWQFALRPVPQSFLCGSDL